MTLNAVQTFAKELYDGLSTPYLPPLKAYIVPQAASEIGHPEMYIWARTSTGKRLTMGRGSYTPELVYIQGSGGNRTSEFELAMWVTCEMQTDAQNADEAWATLIGTILRKAWSVKLVMALTDPTTDEASGLLDFGERWTIDQAPPLMLEAEGPLRLAVLITLSVRENFPG